MTRVSLCGWLLSVLRYPRGTGIYTDDFTYAANCTNNSECDNNKNVHYSVGKCQYKHTNIRSCLFLYPNRCTSY